MVKDTGFVHGVDPTYEVVVPPESPESAKRNKDLSIVWGVYRRLLEAGKQFDVEKASEKENVDAEVEAAWNNIVENLPAGEDVDLQETGEEFKRELIDIWHTIKVGGSDY